MHNRASLSQNTDLTPRIARLTQKKKAHQSRIYQLLTGSLCPSNDSQESPHRSLSRLDPHPADMSDTIEKGQSSRAHSSSDDPIANDLAMHVNLLVNLEGLNTGDAKHEGMHRSKQRREGQLLRSLFKLHPGANLTYCMTIQCLEQFSFSEEDFGNLVTLVAQNDLWDGFVTEEAGQYYATCFERGNEVRCHLSAQPFNSHQRELIILSDGLLNISLLLLFRAVKPLKKRSLPSMLYRLFGFAMSCFPLNQTASFLRMYSQIEEIKTAMPDAQLALYGQLKGTDNHQSVTQLAKNISQQCSSVLLHKYSHLVMSWQQETPSYFIKLIHYRNHFTVVSIACAATGDYLLTCGGGHTEEMFRICVVSQGRIVKQCLQTTQSFMLVRLDDQQVEVYVASTRLTQEKCSFSMWIQPALFNPVASTTKIVMEAKLKEEYTSYTTKLVKIYKKQIKTVPTTMLIKETTKSYVFSDRLLPIQQERSNLKSKATLLNIEQTDVFLSSSDLSEVEQDPYFQQTPSFCPPLPQLLSSYPYSLSQEQIIIERCYLGLMGLISDRVDLLASPENHYSHKALRPLVAVPVMSLKGPHSIVSLPLSITYKEAALCDTLYRSTTAIVWPRKLKQPKQTSTLKGFKGSKGSMSDVDQLQGGVELYERRRGPYQKRVILQREAEIEMVTDSEGRRLKWRIRTVGSD